MSPGELIEAFQGGDIGPVEFFELAQDLGISFDEIGRIMTEEEAKRLGDFNWRHGL